MKSGQEVKVAIIVGAIMITICLICFVTVKSKNKLNEVDLKVYKVNQSVNEKGEAEYKYISCEKMSTDQEIAVYQEMVKALKLTDDDIVTGKKITGTYKVVYNGKAVMFDALEDENIIYLGETQRLYNFDSKMYEVVKNHCG